VQGKQAKIVSPTQERAILGYLETTRYPHRDRVMFLLSMKAGLRAKEMAALTWAMVTDAAGQIAEAIHLQNRASKGTTGGRTIPLHPDLQSALTALQSARGHAATGSVRALLGARWTVARRTRDAGPLLPARRAKCPRSGAACGTCKSSPGIPASP
jgi:integrase